MIKIILLVLLLLSIFAIGYVVESHQQVKPKIITANVVISKSSDVSTDANKEISEFMNSSKP